MALRACDALLSLLPPSVQSAPERAPDRVLLALGGHLGDAVIATTAIDALSRTLPAATIGIVMPSWSRAVLAADPRLTWIHEVDHWKSNRSGLGLMARWRRYRSSRRAALSEIRRIGYDAAVDLSGYFPNMAALLRSAEVPIRLGFESGGCGPLYTRAVAWGEDHRHVADRQVELVRLLAPRSASPVPRRYSLAGADSAQSAERVAALLETQGVESESFILVHMGVGAPERQWRREHWTLVVSRLAADGHRIVFSGRGRAENAAIEAVRPHVPEAINLCDRLQWAEFVELVRASRLVLTVETAAAHVASACDRPAVVIWSGITSPSHWAPLGSSVSLVTHSVSCAPCFRSRGCAAMSCLRELTPDEVLREVQRRLETPDWEGDSILDVGRAAPNPFPSSAP